MIKKIAPARAPEEPINGALNESDWGGRTKRAAPHNKHVPRNKERRKQHPGTRINIPASSEAINREKDTPHNPHTPPTAASKQVENNKRPAPPPVPINRDEQRRSSNQPPALSHETRDAVLSTSPNTETMNAGKQAADRHGKRATSDKPNRTARRHGKHRTATRPDKRQARRGERANDSRGTERAGRGQATGGARQTNRHSKHKKKTRRGFHHLIPVSRPTYLIGIGLSEAPTICSTRSFAAFLVLKP